jgi:predicted cation transporter
MPAGNNLFNLLRSVSCAHEIFAGKLLLPGKIHKMQLAGRLRITDAQRHAG